MTTPNPQNVTAGLDEVIDALQDNLLKEDPTTDNFSKIVDQLDKLYKIKSIKKKDETGISKETLITVLGNLAGIVLILSFERAHVVTSKALGFVLKPRV